MRTILITGGAGFIGSAVIRHLVGRGLRVLNVDKLTYAGNAANLASVARAPNYRFVHGDIGDVPLILSLMREHAVDGVMHLAAESHVDRSIDGATAFVDTNVVGTFRLLGVALDYWSQLDDVRRARFRFHHVSTDEVFGDLPFGGKPFTEEAPYAPSSPYAASKAAGDHFVRAWYRTYGLPVVLSNCSNNYGPYCFPEKLIPLAILNALEGKPVPIYGDGEHARDWLHVDDHALALEAVLARGGVGESYNIGGGNERSNRQVVEAICDLLDARLPLPGGRPRRELIMLVADRPGHDRRYAIDATKIKHDLGWNPRVDFEAGLADTVDWYLDNRRWWEPIRAGRYTGERLGINQSVDDHARMTSPRITGA